MIPLPKNISILIMLCLGIVTTSLAQGFLGTSTVANLGTLVPIVLIAEFLIYAGTAFFANSAMSLGVTFLLASVMLVSRTILAVLGFFIGSLALSPADSEFATQALMLSWVGQPVGVILQVLLMMIAAPHLVEMFFPALLGNQSSADSAARKSIRAVQEGKPTGGFIQVFSFDELSGLVRKTPGLEGFLIFSREGFVVWNDVPHKFSVDQVAATLMSAQAQLNASLRTSGMTEIKKTIVESKDHLVFVSELNQNFGLILFYNSRTKLSECENRLSVLDKTVKEFLQWKYPGLSLATPMKAYKA